MDNRIVLIGGVDPSGFTPSCFGALECNVKPTSTLRPGLLERTVNNDWRFATNGFLCRFVTRNSVAERCPWAKRSFSDTDH